MAKTSKIFRWPDPTPIPGLLGFPIIHAVPPEAVADLTSGKNELDGEIWIPNKAKTEEYARTVTTQYCCLSIEVWYLGADVRCTDAVATRHAGYFATVLEAFRKGFSGSLGMYGQLPMQHTSWAMIDGMTEPGKTERWQARNNLVNKIIRPLINFYAPDQYARHDTFSQNRRSFDLMYGECKRLKLSSQEILGFGWHRHMKTREHVSWDIMREFALSTRYNAHGAIIYNESRRPVAEDDQGYWQGFVHALANGWNL